MPEAAGHLFAGSARNSPLIRLLVSCADRPGIVAAIAGALFRAGSNITESSQFITDPLGGRFLLRMEFDPAGRTLTECEEAFAREVVADIPMDWSMWPVARPKRLAIMCSTSEHCALDLLWKWRQGDLHVEVAAVIANHDDLRHAVEPFGVPFHHIPVPPGGKPEAEQRALDVLADASVDAVILARYMQILTGDFLSRVGVPVINIHHSLLPSFVGAEPYRKAHERGVKVIGATAHYVTEELDAGPIIAQGVEPVSHQDDVTTLRLIGKNIERVVLAKAVSLHAEDRVQIYENRAIVH